MRWIFGDKAAADEAAKAAAKAAAEKAEWQHKTTGVYLTDEKRAAAHVARAARDVKLAADPAHIKAEQDRVKAEQASKVKQAADQEAKQKELNRQAVTKLHMTEARYSEIQKQREVSKAKAVEADKLKKQAYEAEVAKTHADLRAAKKPAISFTIPHGRAVIVQKDSNLANGGLCYEVRKVREEMEDARKFAPTKGMMGLFKGKKQVAGPVDPTLEVLGTSIELRK